MTDTLSTTAQANDAADENILSIPRQQAAAPAPDSRPQVLDDVFTPPPFMLARDVRREANFFEAAELAPPADVSDASILEDVFDASTDEAVGIEVFEPSADACAVPAAEPAASFAGPQAGATKPREITEDVKPPAVTAPAEPQDSAADAQALVAANPVTPPPAETPLVAAPHVEAPVIAPPAVETPVIAAARVETPVVKARVVASRAAAPKPDNYAVGMRILRISPAWLLLSSVGFFLVIFLLSWLYQPATQPVVAAAADATNHSADASPAANLSPATNLSAAAAAPAAVTAVPTAPAAPAAESAPVAPPEPASEAAAPQIAAPETKAAPAAAVRAPEAAASQPDASGGRFAVQVGSYNSQSEANERVSRLRGAGYEARAAAVEIPQRGTWFRVYVGSFRERAEAARFGGELRAKGAADAALVAEVK